MRKICQKCGWIEQYCSCLPAKNKSSDHNETIKVMRYEKKRKECYEESKIEFSKTYNKGV